MKILKSLIFFLIISNTGFSQVSYEIDLGKPHLLNGIEYGYEIRNERRKEVKKEEFSRFEITAYITNKSGCSKLLLPNRTLFGIDYQDVMADFDCVNATGKRMTSKSAKVRAKDFNTPYTYIIKGADGKDFKNNVMVKVGNMLRNGETITNNFVVIVPDGEHPMMKVRIVELKD